MKRYRLENWEWFQLLEEADIQEVSLEKGPLINTWFRDIKGNRSNYLHIDTSEEDQEILSGSLIYHREIDKKEDYEIFHFFLSRDTLITYDYKDNSLHIDRNNLIKEIKHAQTPIEGFMVILGKVMTDILYHIDAYEQQLEQLIWDVKQRNSIKTLDKVYQSRHELLVWKNVMIPFLEIRYSLEEAFGEEITKGKVYARVTKRIERGLILVEEYQKELNNLVNFEEVVSQHRGNEIMKTLTVFTTICTPIMAWGALWGMNFEIMPELKWKFGYVFSLAVIIGSTVVVYFYLKSRGWMGDLLKARKKNSFFR
ncbi:Mg2 transporter protein CorA family protein [Niallia circulans]|uniref:magnesium transporter CorA family protein n=1 Tax=Niallia TaxID=2837506 RepID=UPI00077C8ED7|nr:magnesium transporter CorA family protein [Niallia circulans]MDR4317121.1 Mg2+ transporter protein, CorA-like protein [Niallia circulans]MED3838102.1 magnesium transporter CorA family protein [Niallia circulans]MED4241568.1 magnesium transporter CorA family protein [Niallia circulans]MED4247200.1 magnesium transporter CorA family protein [Niallia circulans]QKH59931.1 Mg2+ transporter protein, CorA-like protein [Niallia circulans]